MPNQLFLTPEVVTGAYGNDVSTGIALEKYYGLTSKSQLGFSVGISSIPLSFRYDYVYFIPILASYRTYFKQFFIEPQIGIGAVNGRFNIGGDYSRPSSFSMFGGVRTGYTWSKVQLGARFAFASPQDGFVGHDETFTYWGLFAAFQLASTKK